MLRNVLRIGAIILIAGLLALATETLYFNHHAIKANETNLHFSPEDLLPTAVSFSIQGGDLVADQDQASIRIKNVDRFVHQMILTYTSETDDTYYLRIYPLTSENTVPEDDQYRQIDDRYQALLSQSATPIDDDVGDLLIIVPDAGLKINNIELDSRFDFNWPRLLLIWFAVALLLILLVGLQAFSGHCEYLFITAGLFIGFLLVWLSPVFPTGWDEQIHFRNIYFNSYHETVHLTQAAERYANLQLPQSDSIFEQKSINNWLNSLDNDSTAQLLPIGNKLPSGNPWRLNQVPYALFSLVFWLARLFGMSFVATLLTAKLAGLLMYLLITALAIRIMPFGKHLLAVYALLPTLLFQATRLTYDTLTIASAFLFFAVILAELTTPEKILALNRMILLACAAILMTCFKTVYLPLVFLAYLLPATKFASAKDRLLYHLSVTLLIVGMALNFLLPALGGSAFMGDVRVEGTNVAGQISFIFSHPATFLKMLWTGITGTLGNYLLDNTSILTYSYAGSIEQTNLAIATILVLFFLALTDHREAGEYGRPLRLTEKLNTAVLIAISMLLIWTALYLSFTPVGLGQVDGVQPRYYFPLAIPFLMLFSTGKIRHEFNPVNYNRLAFLPVVLVNLYGLLTMFMIPFNR
jgi:uncharacterized membrane protein